MSNKTLKLNGTLLLLTTTQSPAEMHILDDPVFYVFLVAICLYSPAFVSQVTLLIQIWKHRLADGLSANLIINIVIWAVFLFLGISIGKYNRNMFKN